MAQEGGGPQRDEGTTLLTPKRKKGPNGPFLLCRLALVNADLDLLEQELVERVRHQRYVRDQQ